MSRFIAISVGVLLCLLSGCDQPEAPPQPPAETAVSAPSAATEAPQTSTPAAVDDQAAANPAPPAPPVDETFEAQPQLTLLPRVGSYRPEEGQAEQLGFWRTFMEHLTRTSGVAASDPDPPNKAFAMRGVSGTESSGFFSPLAVKADQRYRLSFKSRGELSADEQAGVGLLEFDRFLWLPGQYPESLTLEHQVNRQQLLSLQSSKSWQHHELEFTTGPKTGMIHLVFYRDGKVNREPLWLDDSRIEAVD